MNASGLYPRDSTASFVPWAARWPSTLSSIGISTIGKQLLGRRVGEGSQARALATYENDGSHPEVVVVPADLLVVVLPAVVVCRLRSRRRGALRGGRGRPRLRRGGRDRPARSSVSWCSSRPRTQTAVSTLAVIAGLGSGTLVPFGTNAMITISPLVVKRTVRRSPVCVVRSLVALRWRHDLRDQLARLAGVGSACGAFRAVAVDMLLRQAHGRRRSM